MIVRLLAEGGERERECARERRARAQNQLIQPLRGSDRP